MSETEGERAQCQEGGREGENRQQEGSAATVASPLIVFFVFSFAVGAHPDISHHRRLDVRHAQLEQLGGALHGPRLHPASVAKVVVVEGGATNAAGQN